MPNTKENGMLIDNIIKILIVLASVIITAALISIFIAALIHTVAGAQALLYTVYLPYAVGATPWPPGPPPVP